MKEFLRNFFQAVSNMEFPDFIKNGIQKLKTPWISFTILFVFGLILFLPVDRFQGVIVDQARKAGLRVSMGPIGIGRGVFPEGGLLGLSAKAFRYDLSLNKSLECDSVKISPQIWRLFFLQLQTAVVCKKNGAGTVLITIRSGFPFKISKPTIFVNLDDVDLSVFGEALGISGIKGIANGSIKTSDLAGSDRYGLPGELDLTLDFTKFRTPPFNDPNMGFALPSIPVQTASIDLYAKEGAVELKSFKLGSEKNQQIYGDFKGKFKMQPVLGMMFPAGELAGKIKVDKETEDSINSGTSLNGLFGTVKPSGFREFKKKKLTAPQSILFPPEE